jgi:hypothetical protein
MLRHYPENAPRRGEAHARGLFRVMFEFVHLEQRFHAITQSFDVALDRSFKSFGIALHLSSKSLDVRAQRDFKRLDLSPQGFFGISDAAVGINQKAQRNDYRYSQGE